jgi:hypothetical protein
MESDINLNHFIKTIYEFHGPARGSGHPQAANRTHDSATPSGIRTQAPKPFCRFPLRGA